MYNLIVKIQQEKAEEYENKLFQLGAFSVAKSCGKVGRVVLTALFDSCDKAEAVSCIFNMPDSRIEAVADDWMNRWLQYASPVYLVPEVMVVPGNSNMSGVPEGITLLHVVSEDTFGYGSHPTTRICAGLLRDLSKEMPFCGLSVLDIGCGSGILSLYAEILGAEDVLGIDIDRSAVDAAFKNCEINGMTSCRFQHFSLEEYENLSHDICIVNIPVAEYEKNMEKLLDITVSSRYSVLSGFSCEKGELIKKLFEGTLKICKEYEVEEWEGVLAKPVVGDPEGKV